MAHRFFAPPNQISSSGVLLDADESHHLMRVMRLGVGAQVQVFDGSGREYSCDVVRTARNQVELAIVDEVLDRVESPLRVTLGLALIKSDKFDWAVQKATELGARQIIPLATKFSEVLKSEQRGEKRIKRWERISLEALKQCGRRRLVEIGEPVSWDQYFSSETSQVRLVFSERGGGSLADVMASKGPVRSTSIAIGPEGGWSEEEISLAEAKGFVAIHLGPRILRSETAAVAALTLVQHRFGDLDALQSRG